MDSIFLMFINDDTKDADVSISADDTTYHSANKRVTAVDSKDI